MQQLIQKYKIDDKSGLINYYQFCDNIDSVFREGTDTQGIIQNSLSSAVRFLIFALSIVIVSYRLSIRFVLTFRCRTFLTKRRKSSSWLSRRSESKSPTTESF